MRRKAGRGLRKQNPAGRPAGKDEDPFLKRVLEQMPVGVILAAAPTGAIKLENGQARKITGRALSQAGAHQGYWEYKAFHRDGRPYQPDEWPLARSMKNGETVLGEEMEFLHPGGGGSAARVSSSPVRDNYGQITGGVAILHDAAGRQAPEPTWEPRVEPDTLYQTAPVGLAFFDSDLRFVRVNQRLAAMNGRSPADHIGKRMQEVVPDLADSIEPLLRKVLRSGRPVIDQEVRGTTAGSDVVRTWLIGCRPVANRHLSGVSAAVLDITARKKAEEARLLDREKLARSESADRAKEKFLATLSHELRTPLTAILGWSRLLQSGNLDEEAARSALEAIQRNAKLQAKIVDDLLDIARILSGKVDLDTKRLRLGPLMEATARSLEPAARAKTVGIRAELGGAAAVVAGDPERLHQVIWNLLSNAIKYTPSGGEVELRLECDGFEAEITVADTGPGIPVAFLPYLFDPFWQAESSATQATGGLGLGLAIVRHLVEQHGGTVHAENRAGGAGAQFTVRLPLAQGGGSSKKLLLPLGCGQVDRTYSKAGTRIPPRR
jgi:PAS domain S-box-containing protein